MPNYSSVTYLAAEPVQQIVRSVVIGLGFMVFLGSAHHAAVNVHRLK